MDQLADICGVNIKTIKRDIEFLKSQEIIKRKGGRKAGYWEVLDINKLPN
jgi:DeoR/GlpR family transcriptional regulator of sugar metabolism